MYVYKYTYTLNGKYRVRWVVLAPLIKSVSSIVIIVWKSDERLENENAFHQPSTSYLPEGGECFSR